MVAEPNGVPPLMVVTSVADAPTVRSADPVYALVAFMLSVPPFIEIVPDPSALPALAFKMPALMVVPPVYAFQLIKLIVPLPVLVRPAGPPVSLMVPMVTLVLLPPNAMLPVRVGYALLMTMADVPFNVRRPAVGNATLALFNVRTAFASTMAPLLSVMLSVGFWALALNRNVPLVLIVIVVVPSAVWNWLWSTPVLLTMIVPLPSALLTPPTTVPPLIVMRS